MKPVRLVLLLSFLLPALAGAQTPPAPPHSRGEIVAAATDIVQKARYCTLVTIGEDGHPQARIVDPLGPDASFTMWIATNPLTRKVAQIRRDPRVTLLCFDAATSSYITVLGRGSDRHRRRREGAALEGRMDAVLCQWRNRQRRHADSPDADPPGDRQRRTRLRRRSQNVAAAHNRFSVTRQEEAPMRTRRVARAGRAWRFLACAITAVVAFGAPLRAQGGASTPQAPSPQVTIDGRTWTQEELFGAMWVRRMRRRCSSRRTR